MFILQTRLTPLLIPLSHVLQKKNAYIIAYIIILMIFFFCYIFVRTKIERVKIIFYR